MTRHRILSEEQEEFYIGLYKECRPEEALKLFQEKYPDNTPSERTMRRTRK